MIGCHRVTPLRRFTRAILVATVFLGSWLPAVCEAADDVAVSKAISHGIRYLKESQKPDGSWNNRAHPLGETALAGWALVAGGERRDSPAVRSALKVVRDLARGARQTYDVSLAAMFLDVVGEDIDSDLIRDLGRRLAGGQCGDGSWSYQLDRGQRSGDNSNTQFAALACWICRRHGADLDATIQEVDGYFRRSANGFQGGWGYHPGADSSPSMTCAGLVALAARQGLALQRGRDAARPIEGEQERGDGPRHQPLRAAEDPVVQDALNYLGRQLASGVEPAFKWDMYLYFYWSLERVGVIYGLTQIGETDWYDWGSKRILREQSPDGSWESSSVDTSLALLFLSRANVAADLTHELEGWAGSPPPSRNGFLKVERRPRLPPPAASAIPEPQQKD